MAGRGFAGYLASVRSDEHECACSHIRRRHALIYGPRRSRYGGVCTACPCERFTPRPPVERATWRMRPMPECPQVGAGGAHCDGYDDGHSCCYCGAENEDDDHA